MLWVDPNRDFAHVVNQAAAGRSLTGDEQGLVRTYIQQHCGGMTTDEIVVKLCSYTETDNPNPAPLIPRTEWPRDELYNTLLQATTEDSVPFFLALHALAAGEGEAAQLALLTKTTLNSPLVSIDLTNPMVSGAMSQLLAIGLLTPAVYEYITTKPDPDWQQTVIVPSPLEQMGLGQGAIVTAPEVEALLA